MIHILASYHFLWKHISKMYIWKMFIYVFVYCLTKQINSFWKLKNGRKVSLRGFFFPFSHQHFFIQVKKGWLNQQTSNCHILNWLGCILASYCLFLLKHKTKPQMVPLKLTFVLQVWSNPSGLSRLLIDFSPEPLKVGNGNVFASLVFMLPRDKSLKSFGNI